MTILRKILFVLFMSALAFLGIAGCANPQEYSSIPQSRPAEWEGRIPGMGR